jgi:hypothetical protein
VDSGSAIATRSSLFCRTLNNIQLHPSPEPKRCTSPKPLRPNLFPYTIVNPSHKKDCRKSSQCTISWGLQTKRTQERCCNKARFRTLPSPESVPLPGTDL